MGKQRFKCHRLFSSKKFLNKPFNHSDASIWSQVIITESSDYVSSNVGLKIKDCERAASICLSLDDKREALNSIHKVGVLIDELIKLRKNLQQAWLLKQDIDKKVKEYGAKQKRKKAQGVPSST